MQTNTSSAHRLPYSHLNNSSQQEFGHLQLTRHHQQFLQRQRSLTMLYQPQQSTYQQQQQLNQSPLPQPLYPLGVSQMDIGQTTSPSYTVQQVIPPQTFARSQVESPSISNSSGRARNNLISNAERATHLLDSFYETHKRSAGFCPHLFNFLFLLPIL